jgi:Ca2+-binding EF-hand superfamily protein
MKEIELLLERLNYNVEKSTLKDLVRKFDADKSGYIDFDEFQ